MEPQIKVLAEKKLVGIKCIMSLANNQTGALWASFMPKRKSIQHVSGTALYSLQVYPPSYFEAFNPNTPFDKWAAIEVSESNSIPDDMDTLTLPQGLYAVFHYKGLSTDNAIYQYIYTSWLPKSEYILDNRPHFELLGEKYNNNDPDSEEEIWIPIKKR
jgi:AraC family transcriptional regulator